MTNEKLCLLAQEGDPSAMEMLVENILPSIRIAAARIKSGCSGLQIETKDLVQEALIGFLKAIQSFCPGKDILFQTYASSVAVNAMLDYIRKCKAALPKTGPLLSLDAPHPGFDPAEGTYADILLNNYTMSPEQLFIKKETIQEVRAALQMISERERTYLHFRYGFIDGMEHDRKETAYHFHLSISRAKSIEQSGLRNCRWHLPER